MFHMDPGNQPRLEAPLCLKLQTRATIYLAGNPSSSKLGGRMIGALYSLAADGVNRIECAYASKGKQIEPSTRMWPWPPPRPLYSCHPSACLPAVPARHPALLLAPGQRIKRLLYEYDRIAT